MCLAALKRSRLIVFRDCGQWVQVERRPDGDLEFRHPNDWVIPDVPPPARVSAEPVHALRALNDACGSSPDAHTATPEWRGERLDVAYAIDVLHPLAR